MESIGFKAKEYESQQVQETDYLCKVPAERIMIEESCPNFVTKKLSIFEQQVAKEETRLTRNLSLKVFKSSRAKW
ncbi:hypothetical protein L596_012276 [Steinernema carpocapsae]|uniref:Uncharacterized protein n=1 Tax=Steinernema carpocapsae TaxID=34508 RepID=A0A4U5NXE2_STECR|nr:hypothetical protein L596_012276 [Steinernema carpocapsae]